VYLKYGKKIILPDLNPWSAKNQCLYHMNPVGEYFSCFLNCSKTLVNVINQLILSN